MRLIITSLVTLCALAAPRPAQADPLDSTIHLADDILTESLRHEGISTRSIRASQKLAAGKLGLAKSRAVCRDPAALEAAKKAFDDLCGSPGKLPVCPGGDCPSHCSKEVSKRYPYGFPNWGKTDSGKACILPVRDDAKEAITSGSKGRYSKMIGKFADDYGKGERGKALRKAARGYGKSLDDARAKVPSNSDFSKERSKLASRSGDMYRLIQRMNTLKSASAKDEIPERLLSTYQKASLSADKGIPGKARNHLSKSPDTRKLLDNARKANSKWNAKGLNRNDFEGRLVELNHIKACRDTFQNLNKSLPWTHPSCGSVASRTSGGERPRGGRPAGEPRNGSPAGAGTLGGGEARH